MFTLAVDDVRIKSTKSQINKHNAMNAPQKHVGNSWIISTHIILPPYASTK